MKHTKYAVVHKNKPVQKYFETAREVGIFLWGQDIKDWDIYQRQDNLVGPDELPDVLALQTELKNREH